MEEDATFVLTNLDSKNVKALYRRSQLYKAQERWSDALRDLDLLL
jgi:hypothetical protein